MPWILCGPGLPPEMTGRVGRFDGDGAEIGLLRAKIAGRAGDRAARADAGHEDIDLASGVFPNLRAGGPLMDVGIGRIVELLRNPGIGRRVGQLLGLGNRALHAVLGRSEHQVGAQAAEQRPPLDAHRLGHGERQRVAFRRGDEGQGNARVAAGGLDDVRFRGQPAGLLRGFDHGATDAVFHAVAGIEELQLRQHRCRPRRHDAVEFHQGSVVRRGDDVAIRSCRETCRCLSNQKE